MSSGPVRVAAGVAVGCGGGVVLIAAIVAALITTLTGGLFTAGAAAPSADAVADIPATMLMLYQQAAATCPGLPWAVLAGIGKMESDHDRAKDQVSVAGAVGPMQFLPATFAEYDQPVPPGGATPPTPWDPTDAVFAAARLLCANGARDGKNIPGAVFAYNHDRVYVTRVLAYASQYAAAVPTPSAAPGTAAAKALAFARSQLGVPYQWGAESPGHAFDCSGLTQAAYAAAGVELPRVAQDQYNAGPRIAKGVPILPGDLVFFGDGPSAVSHVGIAVSATDMIDAPHAGALTRLEPITADLVGVTRPG
jgi:cell wall-associated NlpC family hydrolase